MNDQELTPGQRRVNRLAELMLVPLALILGVLIGAWFTYDFSRVDGPSMLPTLRDGDRLLITKGLPDPTYGDVAVVRVLDNNRPAEIVKRIVAMPGDEIRIDGDHLWVNGREETRTAEVTYSGATWPRGSLTVPPGHVWVMGDNRPVSLDSRRIGPVPIYSLHGQAVAIFAPLDRIRLVPSR